MALHKEIIDEIDNNRKNLFLKIYKNRKKIMNSALSFYP